MRSAFCRTLLFGAFSPMDLHLSVSKQQWHKAPYDWISTRTKVALFREIRYGLRGSEYDRMLATLPPAGHDRQSVGRRSDNLCRRVDVWQGHRCSKIAVQVRRGMAPCHNAVGRRDGDIWRRSTAGRCSAEKQTTASLCWQTHRASRPSFTTGHNIYRGVTREPMEQIDSFDTRQLQR